MAPTENRAAKAERRWSCHRVTPSVFSKLIHSHVCRA